MTRRYCRDCGTRRWPIPGDQFGGRACPNCLPEVLRTTVFGPTVVRVGAEVTIRIEKRLNIRRQLYDIHGIGVLDVFPASLTAPLIRQI